jgi:hypothetical protein
LPSVSLKAFVTRHSDLTMLIFIWLCYSEHICFLIYIHGHVDGGVFF